MSKPKLMGLGPLGGPNKIFPRQYRFTLNSAVTNLEYFVKNVDVSYTKQTLDVELIEFFDDIQNSDCPVDAWIRSILSGKIKDDLTITTYDGCGTKLYKIDFHNVSIVDHKLPFDYASSKIVNHHVKFKFKKSERTFLCQKDRNEK